MTYQADIAYRSCPYGEEGVEAPTWISGMFVATTPDKMQGTIQNPDLTYVRMLGTGKYGSVTSPDAQCVFVIVPNSNVLQVYGGYQLWFDIPYHGL